MRASWRQRLYVVIFETETPGGKAFDVALLWAIVASVVVVMLDSVERIRADHHALLVVGEWFFTVLFTLEYVLRLASAPRPFRYARSFFGLIDLAAILPTYLRVLFPGAESLLVIRVFRLLRIFRVLKLGRYLGELNVLLTALRSSRRKITVFLGTVLCIVVLMGAVMYLLEGPENGFTSIPIAMYWAIVTLTTVGYGDIAPQTVPGQVIASFIMILGYSILAVPTGIVSVEMAEATRRARPRHHVCPSCLNEDHARDARYCKDCGSPLDDERAFSDQS